MWVIPDVSKQNEKLTGVGGDESVPLGDVEPAEGKVKQIGFCRRFIGL